MNKPRFAAQVTITVEKREAAAELALGWAQSGDVTACSQGTALAVPIPVEARKADARLTAPDVDCVDAGSGS
jgi:hypothetical protein